MSKKIYLVAYTASSGEVKSATFDNVNIEYSRFSPNSFEYFSKKVEDKTGDKVKFILNIQDLGVFGDTIDTNYPY